jgi:hypothetical protein
MASTFAVGCTAKLPPAVRLPVPLFGRPDLLTDTRQVIARFLSLAYAKITELSLGLSPCLVGGSSLPKAPGCRQCVCRSNGPRGSSFA